MSQINLLTATQLVEKTMPCTLNKLGIWIAVCFAYLASALAGAGVGLIVFAFGIRSAMLATIMAIIGLSACAYILMKLRGSIFVPLRTGHLRVLLLQMQSRETLPRQQQLEQAKNTVVDCFGSVEELAVLERNIRGVLGRVYMQKFNLSSSNPYCDKALRTLVNVLAAFIAEPVLAFAIKLGNGDSKRACKQALTLFIQEMDTLSKPVYCLSGFMYGVWIFFIFVMLFPINWLIGMLPFTLGIWNIVFAMIFAWAIKAAIVESIAVATLIPILFSTIEGKPVSEVAEKQVTGLSEGFFN